MQATDFPVFGFVCAFFKRWHYTTDQQNAISRCAVVPRRVAGNLCIKELRIRVGNEPRDTTGHVTQQEAAGACFSFDVQTSLARGQPRCNL